MKRKIISYTMAAIFALGIFGLFYFGNDIWCNALTESQTVTVAPGDGTIAVTAELRTGGVIEHETLFAVYAMITCQNNNWISGKYEIEPNMGYAEICRKLTTPGAEGIRVVIKEGKQVRQIAGILEEANICSAEDFIAAAQKTDYAFDFLKGIDHENPLEGYLFPDTYYFEENTPAETVVTTMLRGFKENMYREEYIERAKELGYTFDEIIILTSMVESEASLTEDRKNVAGVFFNRLNDPAFSHLQSCVTVEYAMGVKKSIISYQDTLIDSPYNTYKYPGLPIGPICCPGEEALKATLWYTENNYYYFQSDEHGTLHFAETYAEHKAIQKNVQADWHGEIIEVY